MLVGTAFVPTAAHVGADARCRDVNGHYAEHSAAPSSCPSSVGLCIEGEFSGAIRGVFALTATSFTPTADTPLTAVVPFTGDGIIRARIDGRRGDLFFKSAGAIHSVDKGEIVDWQLHRRVCRGIGRLARQRHLRSDRRKRPVRIFRDGLRPVA